MFSVRFIQITVHVGILNENVGDWPIFVRAASQVKTRSGFRRFVYKFPSEVYKNAIIE